MSLTPEEPLFRYPIDNTKFWLWEAEEGEGWTVGSGDHEIAFRLPESTARLIAAAPDLLAALKETARQLAFASGGKVRLAIADAAINKAEGRVDT
jgi:hypothetical protein